MTEVETKTETAPPVPGPRWGLPAPEGVTHAWGARAIFHGGSSFELLWDRQGFHCPDEKSAKRLSAWLNRKGLAALRKRLKVEGLTTQDDAVVRLEFDGHVILASPRRSYGYLYIGAWVPA